MTYLTENDYFELNNHNYLVPHLSKVIEKKSIVKYRENSEAVLLTLIDLNEPRINQLNKFIYEGHLTDTTVVVGKVLYENLNLNIGDEIFIISINDASCVSGK